MITLHVYLSARTGKSSELEAAIREEWLPAMTDQPGFVSAALVSPLPGGELTEMGASVPDSPYEVVAFWRTEQERKDWVARPIHDQVFEPVTDAAESVSWTVQDVRQSWAV